jgi:two-component system response regulator MprA
MSTAYAAAPGSQPALTLFCKGDGNVNVTYGTRVLVVDDEPAVRDSLRRALELEGYDVELAVNGLEAVETVSAEEPDVVVLDVLMPQLDGLAACRRLRDNGSRVPILMLTARAGVGDRVDGLDAGADDYLVKPFALEELLARIRALLRRGAPERGEVALEFADLVLDPATREVTRRDRPVELTRTEFNLLELFMRNPRQVLTRSLIFERVWGYDFGLTSNALDVYIGYLRRKTEAGGEPRLIQTIRGVGYALRET